jgi:hypothetical protein
VGSADEATMISTGATMELGRSGRTMMMRPPRRRRRWTAISYGVIEQRSKNLQHCQCGVNLNGAESSRARARGRGAGGAS